MRPLYLILYFSLRYSLRLFYKRVVVLNPPKKWFSSTIYVSNHANSFMDPLVIGRNNSAVVFFMTRSDVFKWWLKPVLWASHMLPIYRQHDGEDTKSKNAATFNECNNALRKGCNLLIFGEGFTDDTPIRHLKPVKKGSVRIGFGALESMNWSKKICVAAIGVNYTDRNTIGSEYIIANGDPICLNDYKEAYLENPNRVILELSKKLEADMRECITHVEEKEWFSFHENIMQITRKGMNHANHDAAIPLTERRLYSKRLANWINENPLAERPEIIRLRTDLNAYFNLQKRMNVQDRFIVAKEQPALKNRSRELAILLLMWPFAILGFIHGFIPFILAKKFTEKAFKRKVFWGSVKMMLGKLLGALYNIPIVILLNHYVFPSNWFGLVYFFVIPALCYIAYKYAEAWTEFRIKGKMDKIDVSSFAERRTDLKKRIEELVPVA